jgi:hypothetical protein
VLRARDRNRGNLRERRRVLVESGASDHSAAIAICSRVRGSIRPSAA